MSKSLEQLIDELIRREGGYVNHPADKGGPTNWGITQAVARANGYTGDLRQLPRATAEAIYEKLYWKAPGFDRVATASPKIALELFDTGVNMGPGTAATFLQRALNVLNRQGKDYPDLAVDGRIGPRTVAALQALLKARGRDGEKVMLRALDCLQGERYIRLAEANPSQEAFVFGWLLHRIGEL
jgi:lysozyme family protein